MVWQSDAVPAAHRRPAKGDAHSSFCGPAYLKYELGVVPKAFLNMEVKALGVP